MPETPQLQRDLELNYSPGLPAWLDAQGVSLAFAVPPSKLFFIGLHDNGRISAYERTFNKCMGLATAGPDTIYLGTRYQVWRLQHAPAQGEHVGYDRCFVPRRVWTTGYLNCHDVAVDGNDEPLFVNTRFGCLARLSDEYSFVPEWWPPWLPVAERRQGDRCHLNGLAMVDGRAGFVTSVATTSTIDEWRNHRVGGGVVTDVRSGEIVCRDLSMPHSPRWRDGELWLTQSGTGELGRVDLDTGTFEPVAFAPGFIRGLTLHGDYAVIGSSKFRDGGLYSGLPLDARLEAANTEPKLGVFIVDLRTGAIAEWLLVEGPLTELFDVVVLPGVRKPMALGLIAEDIAKQIWFEAPS